MSPRRTRERRRTPERRRAAVQALRRLRVRLRHRNVDLGPGVRLGRGIVWDVDPAARVLVGAGARLGDGCRLHVGPALVRLGEGCVLHDGVRLCIRECCTVGAGARLEDEAVLVDAERVTADPEVPVRLQGLASAPVRIGAGAVVGRGAVVLAGRSVGARALVGPHVVVRQDVPDGGRVA